MPEPSVPGPAWSSEAWLCEVEGLYGPPGSHLLLCAVRRGQWSCSNFSSCLPAVLVLQIWGQPQALQLSAPLVSPCPASQPASLLGAPAAARLEGTGQGYRVGAGAAAGSVCRGGLGPSVCSCVLHQGGVFLAEADRLFFLIEAAREVSLLVCLEFSVQGPGI